MSLIVTGGCSKRKRTRQIIVRLDCRMGLVAVRTKQKRCRTRFSNAYRQVLFREKGLKTKLIQPLDKT